MLLVHLILISELLHDLVLLIINEILNDLFMVLVACFLSRRVICCSISSIILLLDPETYLISFFFSVSGSIELLPRFNLFTLSLFRLLNQ